MVLSGYVHYNNNLLSSYFSSFRNCKWLPDDFKEECLQNVQIAEKALLKAVTALIDEQVERIRQMEGELDGTLWSPRNWNE